MTDSIRWHICKHIHTHVHKAHIHAHTIHTHTHAQHGYTYIHRDTHHTHTHTAHTHAHTHIARTRAEACCWPGSSLTTVWPQSHSPGSLRQQEARVRAWLIIHFSPSQRLKESLQQSVFYCTVNPRLWRTHPTAPVGPKRGRRWTRIFWAVSSTHSPPHWSKNSGSSLVCLNHDTPALELWDHN